MIPQFLASMGGKVLTGLTGAAVMAGLLYAYNAQQQSIGYSEATQEFHEQIQEQRQTVQAFDASQNDQRLKEMEAIIAEKDRFYASMIRANRSYVAENARLKTVLKAANGANLKVVHDVQYVETVVEREVPCLVPLDLVERVDHFAGVLNEISSDRVPNSGETASESPVQGQSPIACAALVERIEVLTARLGSSMIEHRRLSDYVVHQYERYRQFLDAQREGTP